MTRNVPLLDLVTVVSKHARTEAEVISAVVYLVNSGLVRLSGNFKGTRFEPSILQDGSHCSRSVRRR